MKKTIVLRLFIAVALSLTITVSCKKENNDGIHIDEQGQSKNRLSLVKTDFNKLYQMLRKAEDKQNLPALLALKRSKPDFISLSVSNLDNKISTTASLVEKKLTLQSHTTIGSNGKVSVYGGEPDVPTDQPPYDEVLEELVADEAFATMLNEDGEIQVDNIIYKVTPFGTFFASAGDELALEDVFNNVFVQNDYTLRLYDPSTPIALDEVAVTGTEYNDVKLLDQKVFFVDSFIEIPTLAPVEITYEDINTSYPVIFTGTDSIPSSPPPAPPTITLERQQVNNLAAGRPTRSAATQQADEPYADMKDYDIDFRTGFLSLWSTITENMTRYHNFNSNYRVSTLMYNRNYGIIKTLGIKVKFQKKGWLWWNKLNTTEIRAGWDYIAYKSAISVPKITLPSNDLPPSAGAPYLINPTENPYYAMPMYGANNAYAKRYNLYGWTISRGSNNLFTIVLPGWLVPFKPNGLEVPPALYRLAIKQGWDAMKKILRTSAPPSGVSIMNSDPNNFKFPVYSLNEDGAVHYLSINDMENMPKSYNTSISSEDVLSLNDYKIHTFVSPYEQASYNDDKIDIPLDFSTVNIKISTDPSNIAMSGTQIAKSLLTKELGTSFEVQAASVFGAVKYNGQWKGIRLKVKVKD